DRLTIVPFDVRASAVNEATADHLQLQVALDSIRPVATGTRLAPAVSLARRILGSTSLPQRELVVVSDFQRSAWDLGDDVRMPAGTEIVPLDVATGAANDRSVRGVDTRRDPEAPADRVVVTARIVNAGPAVKAANVTLEVGGRTVEQRRVDLPTDGGATVSFAGIPVPNEGAPASVRLDADAFSGDDDFHFLLTRAPALSVLLVEPATGTADGGVFVASALAIGDQPSFDVLSVRADRVTRRDLTGKRLVILNDAGLPPGVGVAALAAFVRGGGGLLNVLGEHTTSRSWPLVSDSLMTGDIAAPVDRLGDKGAVLGYLDRTHPALSLFAEARSGDLSSARFFRYRPLDAASGVLARFDDGSAALVEHGLGRGRVLTWGSSLNGRWNDLPRQAVFLPFLHQLARYASTYRDRPAAYVAGEAVDVADALGDARTASSGAGARYSVLAPSGARLSVSGSAEGSDALELREAGFFEVRAAGAPQERPRIIAANPPSQELEFTSFDPARLSSALAAEENESAPAVAEDPVAQIEAKEREQSIWWYLLVVAALVLLAEGFLASRATLRRIQPRQE
ncbi:MAG: hypothetical protein ABIZ91_14905, partial [Gemmatimonadaceae bacterium]